MPFSGSSESCWEGDGTNVCQKSSRGTSYFPWKHGNIIWLWKLKLCRDLLPFFFYIQLASLELLFSHSTMSDSLRPCGLKPARLPCSSLSPGVCSDSCPLSQWCYLTICPLLPSPPVLNLSSEGRPHQSLFQWVSSSHQVAKVLKLQLQHQSFQ